MREPRQLDRFALPRKPRKRLLAQLETVVDDMARAAFPEADTPQRKIMIRHLAPAMLDVCCNVAQYLQVRNVEETS